MTYAALHCHSTYSFQDGVGSIEHWVRGAKEKGLAGLAITDHGDNSSIAELQYWGKKEQYPVIFGCELYITDDIQNNNPNSRYRHLIVWVKDAQGYKNLCRLHKLAWSVDHFYYKPRITYEELAKHREGLIVGSACIAGAIAADIVELAEDGLILHNYNKGLVTLDSERFDQLSSKRIIQKKAIADRFEWFKHHFGEDFYLEVQFNNQCHDWNHKAHVFEPLPGGLDRQRIVNGSYLAYAKSHNIKLVASPDAHMVHAHEKRVQDCQMGTRYMSSNKSGDHDQEALGWHFKETYYLPSYDEITHHYQHNFPFLTGDNINSILSNTLEVMNKCRDVNLGAKVYLPNFEIPGATTGSQRLIHEIKRLGLIADQLKTDPRYKERLSYELNTLCNNGVIDLSGYFLLLADVVVWARANRVEVGPGRGSAGGCLVAYALGITKIDPIKWGLSFERFIGPARIKKGTLPDIDVDFSDPAKIFDYLRTRWGEDYVCGISANQTFKFKLALKDSYRGLTNNTVGPGLEAIAKLAGDDESDEAISAWRQSEPVIAWINTGRGDNERNPTSVEQREEVVRVAMELRGQMRHRGVHAAAVVVAPEPIHEIIPVARVTTIKDRSDGSDGKWVTQYTMKWVEAAGLVKFDILGLNTLNDIYRCVQLVKENHKIDIDVHHLHWNDQEVFKQFTPDNVTSVFQFDTDVARPYLAQLRPKSIFDLAKITAVARPGAMDSDQDKIFINRWTGKDPIDCLHPALESTLKDTYGVMIFQEDVMSAVQILGGFSAEEADDIRRGMGKKKPELIEAARQRFIDYSTSHYADINQKRATELWSAIDSFARYGFNKSHAMAYAMLAYICQYLKTKFPKEWWCSVLQNEDDESRFRRIYAHVQNSTNVKILSPDINNSKDQYVIDADGNIVTPLSYIKKIGQTTLYNILNSREAGFESLEDFSARKSVGRTKGTPKSIADKNVVLQLIWAGCFDRLHPECSKKQLIERYFNFRMAVPKETKKNKEMLKIEFDKNYSNINMIDEIIKMAQALPVLPVNFHKVLVDVVGSKITPFEKILKSANSSFVVTVGLITDIRYIQTKHGDAAFVEVQNDGELLRLTFWPDSFKKHYEMIKIHHLVKIQGKVNLWNGKHSVVVNQMEVIKS